jgi:hypothetical protein
MAAPKPRENTGVTKRPMNPSRELIPNSAGVKYEVNTGNSKKPMNRLRIPPMP